MLQQIVYLEGERSRVGLIVHQQVEYGRGLQFGEVAGAVSHGTVGDFQQHLQRWPGPYAERNDDGAEKIHQVDRALETSSETEKMPSGPAGDVLHFDSAQRREYPYATIQYG